MIQVKHILCPTDLSAESDEGLRYALALASAHKAKLTLLYCRHPGSVVDWATSSGAARRFQQTLLTRMDGADLKALEWTASITETDKVSETIVAEASTRHADLIVMRSRRRPHAAVLLGSTAEAVSRNAPCPVLVTHPREREWVGFTSSEIDLRRVMVAADFSKGSALALRYALSLAKEYYAEVHLVHVVSHEEAEDPEVVWSHAGLQELSSTTSHRLQQTVPSELQPACNIVTAVRFGKPAQQIVLYASEFEIDLICVGASGAGNRISTMLGSTVDRVLRRAPCPILVARPAKWAMATAQAA